MGTLLSNIWRALLSMLALASASSAQSQAWKPGDPIPSAKEILGGSLTPESDQFLTASNAEFNHKQLALHTEWLRDQKRFDIDMQKALLRVQRSTSAVYCDVQFVGSHQKRGNTWEWAWNNPNVPQALTAASQKARAIGERYQLRYATSGMVPVPDARFPWFLSGIVAKASGAVGVFSAPAGDLDYYFVLFNPRTTESQR
jgi:hypothetical protein